MIRARLLSIAAAIAVPLGASAQMIRGRALDAVTQAPLASALVELRDSTGHLLRQTLTAATGVFFLPIPVPGRYSYRVAAIGYMPLPPRTVDVGSDGFAIGDVPLTRSIVALPDLVTRQSRRFCGSASAQDQIFGPLLANARTALEVMEATVGSGAVTFTVELVHTSTPTIRGATIRADTTTQVLSGWPIQSLDPDSLRRFGWGRQVRLGMHEFYGPDVRTLFADWFISRHCYSVVASADTGAAAIHLAFEPAGRTSTIDIAGEMVLDASTMALKRLTYRHLNLPSGMSEGDAGGWMTFTSPFPGLWVPTAWAIWAPIEQTEARSATMGGELPGVFGSVVVVGRNENSGRVTDVSRLPGH